MLNKKINRRVIIVLICVGALYLYAIYGVFANGKKLDSGEVVANQSTHRVNLANSRGTIYDCNLAPLINKSSETLAVAMPIPEAIYKLKELTDSDINAESAVKSGKPISLIVDKKISTDFIDYFTIPKRYEDNSLCPNLIGYVDGSGQGVDGIESAFNDVLTKNTGGITLNYSVDALGRIIVGGEKKFSNTMGESATGISLTIDSDMQKISEECASKIKKGAIVVVSVPDCKIKALVSMPDYNQNSLDIALKSKNSPLINRAFSEFTPGSIFKLVIGTAALNSGADSQSEYRCTGNITVDGMNISCFASKAHGNVNLHTALQKSCNCYFISLANRLSTQTMYETAMNMGFGTETTLYGNLVSDAGQIPTESQLDSRRKIANFSIGQGDLLVTPLQVAGMINAIASEGIYTPPKIYEGEVTNEKKVIPFDKNPGSVPVMETSVALRIKSFMESAVKYGTAKDGAPKGIISGAKTGTAQTGQYENGKELLNYWHAGYISTNKESKYAIVVLNEGSTVDDNPAPLVYKEIAEYIGKKYME